MSGTGNPVRLEKIDSVAFVELDAPPLNILTAAMMDAISDALADVCADRSLKAVAFTSHAKAFSAGADVGEHRPEQAPAMIAAFSRMFAHLGALDLPIAMAVDGAALGAGFELAMMGDVLLATERAKFGQPEIRLGFFAPVAVAWLPARIGPARAMEITCSGRTYSAAEMHAMGLVSRVVAGDGLPTALDETLADFRRASPLVMRLNARMVRQSTGHRFEQARQDAERVFLDELMPSEDVREGIASFFGKREPVWKNR
ncbi:MAG: enoyl-CoA hydratase/isomerase family protein [Bacteroidales bacterium]